MKNLQQKKKFFLIEEFLNKFFFNNIIFLKPKKVISSQNFNLIQLIMIKNGLSMSKIKSNFFKKIISFFINYNQNFFDKISVGNIFFIKFDNLVYFLNFVYFLSNKIKENTVTSMLKIFLLKTNDQFLSLFFFIEFFKFIVLKKKTYLYFFFYRQMNIFYFFSILNKILYLKFLENYVID